MCWEVNALTLSFQTFQSCGHDFARLGLNGVEHRLAHQALRGVIQRVGGAAHSSYRSVGGANGELDAPARASMRSAFSKNSGSPLSG